MKEHRVRRLPVEGFGGIVAGVISMNDIVLNVGRGKVANGAVVETLQAICSYPVTAAHIAAA